MIVNKIKELFIDAKLHYQSGEIATILTFVALGIITLGIVAGGRLVETGTRFLPKAVTAPTPTPPSCPDRKEFSDITQGSQYYDAVTCLAGSPYCTVGGYDDDTFRPDQLITRAEAVTFVSRYHVEVIKDWGWSIPSTPSFTDVPINHWAYPFIETAKYYGFIVGYGDGRFGPEDLWLHGFCVDENNTIRPCSPAPGEMTRGRFIMHLYQYGIENEQLSQCVDITPTITPTPIVIPPLPDDQVVIPIGEKESLVINIGEPPIDPNTPYISFAIKLFAQEKNPDIKVRLKVVDLVTQLTPAPKPADSCQQAGPGQFLYTDITIAADGNGVYTPKPNSQFSKNDSQFTVSQDGWVPLVGLTPGRIYALYVKGPKHRSVKMITNQILEKGKQQNQNFNWTAIPIAPGDLPNPNNSLLQDCVVNSIDLSLIESRIGSTDLENLNIADVNFDGVVSGADISKVVNTLSTKPDDDI